MQITLSYIFFSKITIVFEIFFEFLKIKMIKNKVIFLQIEIRPSFQKKEFKF